MEAWKDGDFFVAQTFQFVHLKGWGPSSIPADDYLEK